MSKKQYSWITNVALILGVVSAFLYQRSDVPHAFSLALGIAAAVISVATYFYNQFVGEGAPQVERSKDVDVVALSAHGTYFVAEVKQSAQRRVSLLLGYEEEIKLAELRSAAQRKLVGRIRGLTALLEAQRNAELERQADYMQQYLQQNNASRRLRYRFPSDSRLMEPEVELSPREAAACYRQIMRDLVNDDGMQEWAFHLDPKGGLRVSGRKHHPQVKDESENVDIKLDVRAELESGQLSDPDVKEQSA
jgi:hypothetical protein